MRAIHPRASARVITHRHFPIKKHARAQLTTARYTHLTSHTAQACSVCIDTLMSGYTLRWGKVL